MRELTRVGMQSRSLMDWVLRIMANLLHPDEVGPAEAAYKMAAADRATRPRTDELTPLVASRRHASAACVDGADGRRLDAASPGSVERPGPAPGASFSASSAAVPRRTVQSIQADTGRRARHIHWAPVSP